MAYLFTLPDIGEGVAEGEILKWMIREGDRIKEDQPLVEVMTDKVNVQIPSPRTGTVSKIFVKEGEVVKVGQQIVAIEVEGESPSPPTAVEPVVAAAPQQVRAQAQVLQQQPSAGVLATPATRRLARELGVDITKVKGSGPMGRVTEDDVKRAATAPRMAPPQPAAAPSALTAPGREERIPVRGVRKAVAERMTKSVHTAAHVTHIDEVDMTDMVLLRDAFKASAEKKGVKLTYLPMIIKAVIPALKEFPYVNASMDDQAGEIVLKKYYNIALAADTEQGLTVPVVKDADKKDIFALASEIEKLAERARAGQLTLDEVKGSTFTITNPGSIGGLFGTPIINYPEVAILGISRITKRPVVRDGKIEIRDMMFLSLSFDHRVFDGAYAARFTNRVIEIMQDSKRILYEIL
jgi:2-oxoglutarate dehydrogenase complex dihydrolipoamide succinyltransferase (E2) component